MIGETKRWGAFAAAAIFLLAACDDSPTDPGPVPTSIEFNVEDVTLDALGETFELVATVYDQDEEEIPTAVVTWTSSDEEVATVDDEGVVEAIAEGDATITATSGSATATIEVMVEVD